MIDTLLLTTARVCTFSDSQQLTNASGFFFSRGQRLFLVTSRHVLSDPPSGHQPDRIEIELHTDPDDMAKSVAFSVPLYHDGRGTWSQAEDQAGDIDIAVVELDRDALPPSCVYRAFSPEHLHLPPATAGIGATLLIVGFPLGFHDTLHHMPVARQAVIASAFGLRFQGGGYFLTDARTHRGTSGAPVVMRVDPGDAALGDLPWKLLGVHSARLDVGDRDLQQDEALGLNCAWYVDALMTLTG